MAKQKYVSLSKLGTFLENLSSRFALITHKHTLSDISDYKVDTELSPTSENPVQNKVLDAEFDAISDAMGSLEQAIDGKVGPTHSHVISDVTDLQAALDEKADSKHTHNEVTTTTAGFMSPQDKIKLNNLSEVSGITQDAADARYLQLTGGTVNGDVVVATGDETNTGIVRLTPSTDMGYAGFVCTNDKENYTEYTEVSSGGIYSSNMDSNENFYLNPYGLAIDSDDGTTITNTTLEQGAISANYDYAPEDGSGNYSANISLRPQSSNDVISSEAPSIEFYYMDERHDDEARAGGASGYISFYNDSDGAAFLFSGSRISSIGEPVKDDDAATKAYVDNITSVKADSEHDHNDVYYTKTEVDSSLTQKATVEQVEQLNDDVADIQESLGSKASQDSLDTHVNNTTTHITANERTNWNTAYSHSQAAHAPSDAQPNQNAFSNVKVGNTTVAAETTTDTLTLEAGSNVTITPDATNDKITIAATDTTYSAGTGISLSTDRKFSNAGVRSIATGTSNGTISVNTNGTSADVAVKGLGSAAYTASTAYDAAGKADAALASAKEYAKEYADQVKNDLLNGAGTAYDTLKELGELIDDNTDAIDALEVVATGKADKEHTHEEYIVSPNTAAVGQTVVVKAVDESGKPTEWEAIDLPESSDTFVIRCRYNLNPLTVFEFDYYYDDISAAIEQGKNVEVWATSDRYGSVERFHLESFGGEYAPLYQFSCTNGEDTLWGLWAYPDGGWEIIETNLTGNSAGFTQVIIREW